MPLSDEIEARRKEIHTDAYPMSVGELVSIYEQGELEIHPEFQRFFRWTLSQKSRWIESLLLGIPTPSVFVSQRPDGVWDVVDGLQRLSTIFEFMGTLKREDGKLHKPLRLEATKYLPSLAGKKFDDRHDEESSLTEEQRRFLKRAKLDIKIIQRESHESSKFELFQRLNTGGTTLSDQELRNCILISINRDFFEWLLRLSKHRAFLNCVPLSERLGQEQFHIELALRFLLFRRLSQFDLRRIGDNLGDYLTDRSMTFAKSTKAILVKEESAFKATFDLEPIREPPQSSKR